LHSVRGRRNGIPTWLCMYIYIYIFLQNLRVFVNKYEKERLESVSIAVDVAPFGLSRRRFLMTITCAFALSLRERETRRGSRWRRDVLRDSQRENDRRGERKRKKKAAFARSTVTWSEWPWPQRHHRYCKLKRRITNCPGEFNREPVVNRAIDVMQTRGRPCALQLARLIATARHLASGKFARNHPIAYDATSGRHVGAAVHHSSFTAREKADDLVISARFHT